MSKFYAIRKTLGPNSVEFFVQFSSYSGYPEWTEDFVKAFKVEKLSNVMIQAGNAMKIWPCGQLEIVLVDDGKVIGYIPVIA